MTVGVKGTATFSVTLTGATAFPIPVNHATADGTAVSTGSATPGTPDDKSKSGTLKNFPPASETQTITVPITAGVVDEIDEQFFVNPSGATSGATISVAQGIGTITDDNLLPLNVSSTSMPEGVSGATSLVLTVTLSAATTSPSRTRR